MLKGQCPAKIPKIYLSNFHVLLPNATKYATYLDKKILQSKTGENSAGLKGRWKWIVVSYFHFMTVGTATKNSHSEVTLSSVFSRCCVFQVDISSLLSSLHFLAHDFLILFQ